MLPRTRTSAARGLGARLAPSHASPTTARLASPRPSPSSSSSRPFSSSARPSPSSSMTTAGAAALGLAVGALALTGANKMRQEPIQCDAPKKEVQPEAKRTIPDISKLNPAVIDDPSVSMRVRMETYVKLLQHRIVEKLGAEETDGSFFVDQWLRKEGGEGISCVLQDGETFEKAGVNISIVHGQLPPRAIAQMSADHAGLVDRVGYKLTGPEAEVKGLPFFATGLSLVVHPKNPFAPTVHFNYRYFELSHPEKLADGSPNPRYDPDSKEPLVWWFGGGTDLTPIYLFPEDASHFHKTLKQEADKHDEAFYPTWKKWCDRYFWIPHRGEARGVGGIFFDDLALVSKEQGAKEKIELWDGSPSAKEGSTKTTSSKEHDRETLFKTVQSLGNAFIPAYLPILQRRKNADFDYVNEEWQALRRGRYVEFNLVEDRGTKFGLQTPGARIESILMSLPLKARWEYMERFSGAGSKEKDAFGTHVKGEDEKEEKRRWDTMHVLREPKDWA